MKTLFKKTSLALALGSLTLTAQAQNSVATPVAGSQVQVTVMATQAEAVDVAVADAAEPTPVDPGMKLMELVDEWKYGAGEALTKRADNGDVFMGEGTAFVKVTPEATDWADHRLLAYKEALMAAQAQFIEYEGINARAETVSRFFED
ncbi:MAG: hypothetical protein ACPHXW_03825, partial [Marinobacterium sp.]